ncbi:MarR family transcriptional regulator [Sphingomonas sp.]|uniref:MarR family winged helix-turn-helix transcriptional regulator n=1 Tax=Sphingomonas sp. TaxID=28214 RepID=UPI00286B01AC|nr:MarR family transcriptional regulator [Sphingomonas sp.]
MDPMLWEIAETATALRRAFDRRAVSLGVTRAQWRVLAKLNRTPGLRQVDLAEHLDMEAITLCRIVDRLAEAGLVERQADPLDRRAWKLMLTTKSRPLVKKLGALADDLAEEAFTGMAADKRDAMRTALGQIRDNVAVNCPRGKALGQ